MLLRRMKQRNVNKKGFTLAELLVVVAILAILVAVSIPIFTGKLEESREATDVANMRVAKALAVNEISGGDFSPEEWNTRKYPDSEEKVYFAFYDANEGKFKPSRDGIKGYGKGTESDGGISYGVYNSTLSYKDLTLEVIIEENEDDTNEIFFRWEGPDYAIEIDGSKADKSSM